MHAHNAHTAHNMILYFISSRSRGIQSVQFLFITLFQKLYISGLMFEIDFFFLNSIIFISFITKLMD